MSHKRTLDADGLEPRNLLAAAHHAAARVEHPAEVAPPLVLTGSLAIDNAKVWTENYSDASSSTSTPVGGTLGSVGTVTGVWIEDHDPSGDISGADTIRLRDASGTILIAFNNANVGKVQKLPGGEESYTVKQAVVADTGIYTGGSEKGTIKFTVKPKLAEFLTMQLTTTQTT